jgi:hypothetical protein
VTGEPNNMSVEAQLAVLSTKVDQLLDMNRTRGEDHETRLRMLEATGITKKAAYTVVVLVCMVTAAITNVVSFWLK